jgi:hypothetical protein
VIAHPDEVIATATHARLVWGIRVESGVPVVSANRISQTSATSDASARHAAVMIDRPGAADRGGMT